MQVSTHAGNALSMVAGLEAMKHLTQKTIERRNARFEKLKAGFEKAFSNQGIRGQVTGIGWGFAIHLTDQPISNPRDTFGAAMAAEEIAGLIFLGMRYHGVSIYPPLFGCLSTAIDDKEIAFAIDALQKTLEEIRPVVEQVSPHVLI
jgi:glutamate-1-semialdehyde aminotransferase